MDFSKLISDDLMNVSRLQPDGWSDILPDIRFYINNDWCFPIKHSQDDQLAGIGASLCFPNTAWLAHIIVNDTFRNKGIGMAFVKELVHIIHDQGIETSLLIATDLGYPLYKKAGFETISIYENYIAEPGLPDFGRHTSIINYHTNYKDQLLKMDLEVSGEHRESLIQHGLEDALLFVEDGELQGYFLKKLGDGPIIAKTELAGTELMKVKFKDGQKAVIPHQNTAAVKFLLENGYKKSDHYGRRMVLGKKINWKPECMFARIGGNFG